MNDFYLCISIFSFSGRSPYFIVFSFMLLWLLFVGVHFCVGFGHNMESVVNIFSYLGLFFAARLLAITASLMAKYYPLGLILLVP